MNNKAIPSAEKPLAGIKILELSTMVTCSFASMTLAAQGADVIKIEPPLGGDVMRHLGHQKMESLRYFTTATVANGL